MESKLSKDDIDFSSSFAEFAPILLLRDTEIPRELRLNKEIGRQFLQILFEFYSILFYFVEDLNWFFVHVGELHKVIK